MARRKRPPITKDPRVMSTDVLPAPKVLKRALGLDLGNSCGYCIWEYDPRNPVKPVIGYHGMWDLSPQGWDTGALRLLRLQQFLNEVQPDVIFYEDVSTTPPKDPKMLKGVMRSTQWLAALKGHVVTWAEINNVPTHGYSIGVIKKFATGKGNANKTMMTAAAIEQYGWDYEPDDKGEYFDGLDNVADAAHVLALGYGEYLTGLKET